MSQSQLFRSGPADIPIPCDSPPHPQAAERWPRLPCFAAAVVVSLGLWAGLIDVTARLVAWLS
jgi:hypothetical protein